MADTGAPLFLPLLETGERSPEVPVNQALGAINKGLGNSATRNVGTTAGTVAAGDDSRFGAGGSSSSISNGTGSVSVGIDGKTTVAGNVKVNASDITKPVLDITCPPGTNYISGIVLRDSAGNVLFSVRDDGYVVINSVGFNNPINVSGITFPGIGTRLDFWNGAGASEAGITRRIAGVTKATNGGVGYGKFDASGYQLNGVDLELQPRPDAAFTAATTLTNERYACYFDTSVASINQPLPDATGLNGREYLFFKTTSDANTLTVSPAAGQGAATVLSAQDSNVTYRAFSGKWRKVAQV